MDELDLVLYVCDQEHLHLVALKDGTEVHSDTIMGPIDGFPSLKSVCRDERGRFAPCGAGGHAPAALQHIRAERYRKAREMVAAIKAGPRPVPHQKIRELADHLGTMTNAQLVSLRNEHGLKGGRVKDQLKQKITEHLANKPGSAGAHVRDHVPEGTFGEPKNLRWNPDQDQAELREAITRFIGPHGTKEQLAACAGAIDGATVSVEKSSFRPGGFVVNFMGSQQVRDAATGRMVDQEFVANRSMRIENGKKRIHNDFFQGEGAGVSMFGRQVENATKHGFDQIDTHAAGIGSGTPGQHSTRGYNGYYTWPRFGYNAAVPATPAQRLPPHLREAVAKADGKMSGLMKTKEGRDWWMGHGQELLHAVFDLTKGSYSQTTLNTYLHERNILK